MYDVQGCTYLVRPDLRLLTGTTPSDWPLVVWKRKEFQPRWRIRKVGYIYRFSLRVYWLYSIRHIFEEIEAPFLIKWHPEKKCNASSASGASAVASMVCFCCNSRLGIYLLYLYVAIMVETLRRIKDFSVEGALVYLITPWTIWWYTILKNVLEQVRITPDSITYCYGGAWGIGVDNTCPSLASM